MKQIHNFGAWCALSLLPAASETKSGGQTQTTVHLFAVSAYKALPSCTYKYVCQEIVTFNKFIIYVDLSTSRRLAILLHHSILEMFSLRRDIIQI